jgi:hypothetical protein
MLGKTELQVNAEAGYVYGEGNRATPYRIWLLYILRSRGFGVRMCQGHGAPGYECNRVWRLKNPAFEKTVPAQG